jgi:Cysteine dioxygenase type I
MAVAKKKLAALVSSGRWEEAKHPRAGGGKFAAKGGKEKAAEDVGPQSESIATTPAEKSVAAAKKVVSASVAAWHADHPNPSRRELVGLVQGLWKEHRREIEGVMAHFDDRNAYPTRPMIDVGTEKLSVWLLGWRKDDWTEIHDHEKSEAAIHVLRGETTERIYWPDNGKKTRFSGPVQRVERELHEGSSISVPTPYIHAVGNVVDKTATTLHAYYPALNSMNFYTAVKDNGDAVKWNGHWPDTLP